MTQLVAPSPIPGTDLNIVHADYTGATNSPAKKDDDMPLYIAKTSEPNLGIWVTDSQTKRHVLPDEWAFAQFSGQKVVSIADDWWDSIPTYSVSQDGQPSPTKMNVTLTGEATPV